MFVVVDCGAAEEGREGDGDGRAVGDSARWNA
jgi:hypothetical protein